MCVCVCVCVFVNKKNQNNKVGREMLRDCRVPVPFSPMHLCTAQQCSTHSLAHPRKAESHRSEALPPFPVVFVLVWK